MTGHTTFLLPNPHTPVTLFLPKNLSTLKPRPKVNPLSTEEPLNPQASGRGLTLFLPKNLSNLKPRPKVTLLYSVERTREASANHLEQ